MVAMGDVKCPQCQVARGEERDDRFEKRLVTSLITRYGLALSNKLSSETASRIER